MHIFIIKSISVILFTLIFVYSINADSNKPTIAVLDFKSNHLSEGDIVALTNKINQDLFNTHKFTVVERDMVEEVLKEQNFKKSGCNNAQCASEIGKILSVEKICIGSFDEIGNNTVVNAKIINVRDAKIEKMASAECENCTVTDVYRHTIISVVDQLVNIGGKLSKDIKNSSNTDSVNIQITATTKSKIIFYIIPKLGINISSLHVDDNDSTYYSFDSKAGLTFGSGFKFVLDRTFAIEPGLYFSMKGAKFNSYGVSCKDRINYISIPINIQLIFPTKSLFNPFMFIAPMLNFRCSAKECCCSYDDYDFTDETKKAEFALSIGAGSQFNVNKTILFLETRFEFGLSDITYDSEVKTWNISFLFGTGFKVR